MKHPNSPWPVSWPTTASSSRRLAALALLCLCTAALWSLEARADGSKSVTSQELDIRLKGRLPAYEVFEARLLEAEADVEEAKTLPPVKLSMDREEVFIGGEGVALKNSLSVGWSLDLSGRRALQISGARQLANAVRLQTQQAKHLFEVQVFRIFYTAALARLRLESLQSTRVPLAKLVERLEARAAAGDASGLDLARFELELSEHDGSISNTRAELALAELNLGSVLGAESGQRLSATEDLNLPSTPQDTEAHSQLALSKREDLRATLSMRASGHSLVKSAGRWWIPTLDISAGYLNSEFGPGAGPRVNVAHGYLVSVDISVPLFTRSQAEKKRGQARMRLAEAERSILERQTTAAVLDSITLLKSRVERARDFRTRQLVQAVELVEKTEAAYEGGEASALALRDAYRQASEMELRHIELRYLSRLAELELWRATGKRTQGETN